MIKHWQNTTGCDKILEMICQFEIKIASKKNLAKSKFVAKPVVDEEEIEAAKPQQQKVSKGFLNNDRSCYAKSVLQMLLNVDIFRECINNSNSQGPLTLAMKHLIQKITSEIDLLDAMPVRQAAGETFAARIQQDACEFLTEIVRLMMNEQTQIQNLLTGILGYQERCKLNQCTVMSRTIQNIPFQTFIVDLPATDATFSSLFMNWSTCEGYFCSICGGSTER